VKPEVAVVQYDYIGVFWLFNCAFNRRYLRVCETCKTGREVDKVTLGTMAEKDHVPFLNKYGLVLFFAAGHARRRRCAVPGGVGRRRSRWADGRSACRNGERGRGRGALHRR
jgi:hypothetical protein